MGDTLVRQRDTLSLHRTSAEQLEKDRRRNDLRLKGIFENIFDKYTRDFSNTGDEIDLETGQIIVNNGHLAHMRHERDVGSESARRYLRPAAEPSRERQTVRQRSFAAAPSREQIVRPRNLADEESDSDELGSGHKKHVRRNRATRHTNGSTPLRPPQSSGPRVIPDSDASQQSDIQGTHPIDETLVEPAAARRSATTTFTNGILGGVHTIANSLATAAQPQHNQQEAINPGAIQALGQNIAIQIAQFLNQHVGATTNQGVSNDPWSVPPLPANSSHRFRRPASTSVSPAPSRFRTPNPHRSLWAPDLDQPRPHASRPHQPRPYDRPSKRPRPNDSNYTPGLADVSVAEQTSLLEAAHGVPDMPPHRAHDSDMEDDYVPYGAASDEDSSISDSGNDAGIAESGQQQTLRGPPFTEQEDELIRYLKEIRKLPSWVEIAKSLPGRTKYSVATRYYRNIRHIPRPRSPRYRDTEISRGRDEEAHHNYDSASTSDNAHAFEHAPATHSSAYQARTSQKRKRNETIGQQRMHFDNGESNEPRTNDRFSLELLDPRLHERVEVRIPREANQLQQDDFVEEPVMVADAFEPPKQVVNTRAVVTNSSLVHSSPPPSVQVNDSARTSHQAQPQSRVESIRNSARHMVPRTPAAHATTRVRSARSPSTNPVPIDDDDDSYDELSTPAPSEHSGINASGNNSTKHPADPIRYERFTAEEDARLAELRGKGMRWTDIGRLMGRSRDSVRNRDYRNAALTPAALEKPRPAPPKWNADDDALLYDLVNQGKPWEEVPQSFPGRSAASCRRRYEAYLQHAAYPGAKSSTQKRDDIPEQPAMVWLPEEDDALIQLREAGVEFTTIDKILPGRSANACSTRIQTMKRGPETAAQYRVEAGIFTDDDLAERADRLEQLRLNLEEYARGGLAGLVAKKRREEEAARRQSTEETAREQFEEEATTEQLEIEAARERREREAARQRLTREEEAACNRLGREAAQSGLGGDDYRKGVAWTPEEDAALIELRRNKGPGQTWVKLAESMPGRSGHACKKRFQERIEEEAARCRLEREATRSRLDGDDYRTGIAWTPEEDATLIELRRNKRRGETWERLAKNMPGRSGHACKKRYQERLVKTLQDF